MGRALLIGKGPSADLSPVHCEGRDLATVNESYRSVSGPVAIGFFIDVERLLASHDGWHRMRRIVTPAQLNKNGKQSPVRPKSLAISHGLPLNRVSTFRRIPAISRRDAIEKCVAEGTPGVYGGTPCFALHLLVMMGYTDIACIGFDGAGGYARSLGIADGSQELANIHAQHKRTLHVLAAVLTEKHGVKVSWIERPVGGCTGGQET